jgi:phosphate transport system substrate-binding protein
MKPARYTVFIAVVLSVFVAACTERDKKGRVVDTTTSGDLQIAVDESLRPLIEAEIDAFEAIYQYARIHATYMSESEAIESLLRDSVRLAIVTRRLNQEEVDFLAAEKLTPTQRNMATGGVALITHRDNRDSIITISQLKEILQGKITTWKQLHSNNPSLIELVFDNPTSGIVRLLQDSVVNVKTLPSNCFAVENNQAVVEYVSKKTNAIGLIGVEWISDSDESTANKFLNTIRVMGVAREDEFFLPYQAYLALHEYPLTRETIFISREARTGLASGFLSFVASDKGQRIVLKAGLVPATMPVRLVEINGL